MLEKPAHHQHSIDPRPPKRIHLAIPLIILASLFISLMGALGKVVVQEMSTQAMLLWRNLISLVVLLPFLFRTIDGKSLTERLKLTEWKLQLIRGFTSFGMSYLLFYSLQYLPLSVSVLFFNTTPIFIPLVLFFWRGQLIAHRLWWGLSIGFLGIIFVLDPTQKVFDPAALIALASGMIGSISLVSLRLAHYTDSTENGMFYVFTISLVCAGALAVLTRDKSWLNLSLSTCLSLIGMALFAFGYQLCINFTAKFAPLRQVSIFLYCGVIFSFFLDDWFWNNKILSSTIIGFILIVLGSALTLLLYPKDDYQFKKR